MNDYLHSSFANYTFNTFTVEMWINSSDYSSNEIYINFNHYSYLALGGWASDGSFDTYGQELNPNSINSGAGTTPAVNTWHHIAYVYNGVNQILYIDGLAVSTVATTGALLAGNGFSNGLVIGANYDGSLQHSNASFEDIRIWSIARTSAELNASMSTNLIGNETGLRAYYRFEDGAGSSTVTDLTGNGNTLTLMNMDPATDVQTSCGPFTWIDGVTYSSNNNTATHTIAGGAVNGCDSIVNLDLTVKPFDSNVTSNGNDITANEAGAQHQWLDCNNSFSEIIGETSQTFSATSSGNYAVIVTAPNGCSDTTSCELIQYLSIDETSLEQGITVSPNPTNGEFSISSLGYSGDVKIEVMSLNGKLIIQTAEKLGYNMPVNIDLNKVSNGVYIVRVSDSNDIYSTRLIKK